MARKKGKNCKYYHDHVLPCQKLTWQWKIPLFNRKYILKWWNFHCHVCHVRFRGCIHLGLKVVVSRQNVHQACRYIQNRVYSFLYIYIYFWKKMHCIDLYKCSMKNWKKYHIYTSPYRSSGGWNLQEEHVDWVGVCFLWAYAVHPVSTRQINTPISGAT